MTTRLTYDDLPPDLGALLRPRVERLGYLGEFFQVAGHQPDALAHFVRFTESLKGSLPPEVVECLALAVSTLDANDYERNQHERLSHTLGLGDAWVAAVEAAAVTGDTATLAEPVASCVAFARTACLDRSAAAPALADVEALLGEETAVAVALTVGRYLAHSLVVHSFALAPPVPSIFEAAG